MDAILYFRERIIEENTKVMDTICWFNRTVWAKVEDSVRHVSCGCQMVIEPDKF